MGFFQKFKKDLTSGGVKVQLRTPVAVHLSDTTVPITVIITAGEAPAQIKSIDAWILCRIWIIFTGRWYSETISEVQSIQPFMLAPDESKSINFELAMEKANAVVGQKFKKSFPSRIAYAIGQIDANRKFVNLNNRSYIVQASVNVDGVGMNASATQDLQVLKPGEVGTTTINI